MEIVSNNLYTFWLLIFIFISLNIFRNLFFFLKTFNKVKNIDEMDEEEQFNEVYHPERIKPNFKLKKYELIFLGISISYFVTYIIWLIKK